MAPPAESLALIAPGVLAEFQIQSIPSSASKILEAKASLHHPRLQGLSKDLKTNLKTTTVVVSNSKH